MSEHTQDVEQLLKELAQTIAKGVVTDDWQKHDTIKKLNKAYLSQVLELLEDEKYLSGGDREAKTINYGLMQRNWLRGELRTKFIKLWGSE